jgi:hypothetical protein
VQAPILFQIKVSTGSQEEPKHFGSLLCKQTKEDLQSVPQLTSTLCARSSAQPLKQTQLAGLGGQLNHCISKQMLQENYRNKIRIIPVHCTCIWTMPNRSISWWVGWLTKRKLQQSKQKFDRPSNLLHGSSTRFYCTKELKMTFSAASKEQYRRQ